MTDRGFITLILIAAISLIAGALLFDVYDNIKFEEFKVKHNCKLVDRVNGEAVAVPVISANGQASIGFGYTSDKSAWSCDDGVTYWRDE